MDKASAYGAWDCKFESYRGHLIDAKTCGFESYRGHLINAKTRVLSLIVGRRRHAWICAASSPGVEPGTSRSLDDKDTAQRKGR